MTREACEKFVGPMPVDMFLSEFVPRATMERPTDSIPFSISSVSQNEDAFIAAIETSRLCPELKFINTTSHQDSPYPLKPDISIYPKNVNASADPKGQKFLDWKKVDLWIENKNSNDDVFRALTKMTREEERDGDLQSHIKWTNSAYKICGQLISYASALHRSQFRIFSFAVVLFGDSGRLLRWDRSGVIYTDSFNWATQPDTLFEFFWRLNFLSDVDRGYDTTVTSVEDDEAEAALPKLRTYKGLEDVQRTDLHKFLVHDDRAADGHLGCYITPSAVWHTESLFGRSTFGYVAFDVATSKLVYLKDFWRTDLPGIQREGDVYRELHDAQVPNIPVLGRAGDVPISPDHANTAPFAAQRTKTQDYVKGSGHGHEWCPGRPQVDPYVHYRLVLETLGQPLNTFKSTRQLCEVIRDAIVAHTVAYEKTHILHRDVSAGNILITEEGSGVLIDWDLSKKVMKDVYAKPRRHSRTGTWQFISIARLLDPSTRPHEVSDDLESFFWVLLYLVVKCRNTTNVNFSTVMQHVFDQYTDMDRNGIVKGGGGKLACLREVNLPPRIVKRLVKSPCRNVIEELRSVFHDFYLGVDADPLFDAPEPDTESEMDRTQDSRAKDAHRKLRSSEWILGMINGHLASNWDVDDDGSLYKTEFRTDPAASGNRRKRKAADSADGKTTYNQRRQGRLPPSKSVPSGDTLSSQARGFFKIPIAASPHGELRTLSGASPSGSGKARSGSSFK